MCRVVIKCPRKLRINELGPNVLLTFKIQPPLYSEQWTGACPQTTLKLTKIAYLWEPTVIKTTGAVIVRIKFQWFAIRWHIESPLVIRLVDFAPSWIDSEQVCVKQCHPQRVGSGDKTSVKITDSTSHNPHPSIDLTSGWRRVAC